MQFIAISCMQNMNTSVLKNQQHTNCNFNKIKITKRTVYNKCIHFSSQAEIIIYRWL